MSIGDVLGELRSEFPDVTHSKIRFLESEGLIEPARTPSGYRKFSRGDVERLRYILTRQRDSYSPLKRIRESSPTSTGACSRRRWCPAGAQGGAGRRRLSVAATFADSGHELRLSRAELCESAEIPTSC
jgi:hypothetical protein